MLNKSDKIKAKLKARSSRFTKMINRINDVARDENPPEIIRIETQGATFMCTKNHYACESLRSIIGGHTGKDTLSPEFFWMDG